jgi:hypothetical protein
MNLANNNDQVNHTTEQIVKNRKKKKKNQTELPSKKATIGDGACNHTPSSEDTLQESFITGHQVSPNTAKRTEHGHHARPRVTNTLARDDHAPNTEGQYSHSKR